MRTASVSGLSMLRFGVSVPCAACPSAQSRAAGLKSGSRLAPALSLPTRLACLHPASILVGGRPATCCSDAVGRSGVHGLPQTWTRVKQQGRQGSNRPGKTPPWAVLPMHMRTPLPGCTASKCAYTEGPAWQTTARRLQSHRHPPQEEAACPSTPLESTGHHCDEDLGP